MESDWKYFTSYTDALAPENDEYLVSSVQAMVVMRIDTKGNVEYRLQLPDWKIRGEVVRLVEDWEYLRKLETQKE